MSLTFLSRGSAWLADKLPALGTDTDTPDVITYQPTSGRPEFEWTGVLSGERGAEHWDDSGNYIKTIRRTFTGPTATANDNYITRLNVRPIVKIGDEEWSVDAAQSHWGPMLVSLALSRRELSRFEEMEHHGAL